MPTNVFDIQSVTWTVLQLVARLYIKMYRLFTAEPFAGTRRRTALNAKFFFQLRAFILQPLEHVQRTAFNICARAGPFVVVTGNNFSPTSSQPQLNAFRATLPF